MVHLWLVVLTSKHPPDQVFDSERHDTLTQFEHSACTLLLKYFKKNLSCVYLYLNCIVFVDLWLSSLQCVNEFKKKCRYRYCYKNVCKDVKSEKWPC